ncbi:MAG: CDP-diacylglycerol--serine O-phosphatidyltransferase, partial [Haemophilus parainfluenzae]|nr:CDP-diacylglycerol--serine O-phosphatidyltransferase [Haemophilus parainfluenzae]
MLINKAKRAEQNLKNLPFLPLQAEQVEFLFSPLEFKAQIIELIRQAKKRSATNADWYCEQRQTYQLPDEPNMFFGVPINTREVFGVLHIKGFIFDDTVLYSGASINNVYLQQQDKYRYDRYQKIHNAALADSMVNFINDYLLDFSAVHPLDVANRPRTKEIRSA